jgi:hypothetical protein
MRVDPKPGCPKKLAWADRKEAREELLKRWARGDYTMGGTHWCDKHKAYHHTKKIKRTGTNYSYRE